MNQNDDKELEPYYRWKWFAGFFQGLGCSLIIAGVIWVVIAGILGAIGFPFILGIFVDVIVALIAVFVCILFSWGHAVKAVHDERLKIGNDVHEVKVEEIKQHAVGETRSYRRTTKGTKRR